MPTDAEELHDELHDELYSGVHPLEVEEQWRVVGDPGTTYNRKGEVLVRWPHYDFTWTPAIAAKQGKDSAEQGARDFVERINTSAKPWEDGPHLSRRLVAVTGWEQVDA